jgi:hypothetical protein
MLRFEILFQASCNKATVAGPLSYFDHPRHPSIMNEWRPMPNRKDAANTTYLRSARLDRCDVIGDRDDNPPTDSAPDKAESLPGFPTRCPLRRVLIASGKQAQGANLAHRAPSRALARSHPPRFRTRCGPQVPKRQSRRQAIGGLADAIGCRAASERQLSPRPATCRRLRGKAAGCRSAQHLMKREPEGRGFQQLSCPSSC